MTTIAKAFRGAQGSFVTDPVEVAVGVCSVGKFIKASLALRVHSEHGFPPHHRNGCRRLGYACCSRYELLDARRAKENVIGGRYDCREPALYTSAEHAIDQIVCCRKYREGFIRKGDDWIYALTQGAFHAANHDNVRHAFTFGECPYDMDDQWLVRDRDQAFIVYAMVASEGIDPSFAPPGQHNRGGFHATATL
nr:hypothetical protein [Erythrobacter litoralis]